MNIFKHSTVFQAGQYIAQLLIKELPDGLFFHNFQHTSNVVRGVRDIAKQLKVSKEQEEILLIAAWFHDSGLTVTYAGHEAESQKLAKAFLLKLDYPMAKIEQVLSCIAATKMPQSPKTLLEQIICDADLYHLSLPQYCHLQRLLLEEWRIVLAKDCTDLEWAEENIHFLEQHQYWTTYGQEVLQKKKEFNIGKCKEMMAHDMV